MEILTDRPTERFAPGVVLHREGTEAALTIASAEAVADGPGWRLRFEEIGDRDAAEQLRGAYLETVVRPEDDLGRGEFYWHEVIGVTVSGVDGAELGTVRDIYRVGETEVFSVAGGPFGPFDLPVVRAFIRIFAPRRGEIVIDADALDLKAPKRRPEGEERPRAPRRRTRHNKATPGSDAANRTMTAESSADAGTAEIAQEVMPVGGTLAIAPVDVSSPAVEPTTADPAGGHGSADGSGR